ncbi:hypothetical protein ACAG39_10395 [Caldicellulosiruptoraceae bacterium PP1]
MNKKLKNVTFTLPIETINKLKLLVKENYINSLNSGVKEAVEKYIAKKEKEKFKKEMEAAAKDNMFLNDLFETMTAFEKVDIKTGA